MKAAGRAAGRAAGISAAAIAEWHSRSSATSSSQFVRLCGTWDIGLETNDDDMKDPDDMSWQQQPRL